jgi:hypothetical protein
MSCGRLWPFPCSCLFRTVSLSSLRIAKPLPVAHVLSLSIVIWNGLLCRHFALVRCLFQEDGLIECLRFAPQDYAYKGHYTSHDEVRFHPSTRILYVEILGPKCVHGFSIVHWLSKNIVCGDALGALYTGLSRGRFRTDGCPLSRRSNDGRGGVRYLDAL